jgi:hypothetical protein
MLIAETETDFLTEADLGLLGERRRLGRQMFDNPHLLQLLREPASAPAIPPDDALFTDEPAAEHRPWFGLVVLASLGFWYLVLRLFTS